MRVRQPHLTEGPHAGLDAEADQEEDEGSKNARELFGARDGEVNDSAKDHHDYGRKKEEAAGNDPEDTEGAEVALKPGLNRSERSGISGEGGVSTGGTDGGSSCDRASAMIAEHEGTS